MTTPHRSQSLGPGTLTVGETGTDIDLSAQVTQVTVTWENNEEEAVPVLSGEMIPGDDSFTATLEATLFQDMTEDGIIDWSWSNRGKIVPVEFQPTTGTAKVTGTIKVMPVALGGEMRRKNTSDVSWPFVDEPSFTPLTDD